MRRLPAAALAVALLATAACDKLGLPGKTPFNGIDVTGSHAGVGFSLKDPEGRVRTLAEFRGKVVAVFFGYTQCPDVCPTTLSDLAHALQALGPDAARVQVIFITVDPKRDTAELLKNYVPAFNPTFIGLRGTSAETAKVTQDFKIYAAERSGKTPGTYTMDHSAQTMVFDREGRLRLMFPYGAPPEKIAADLRILLNS